MFKDLIGYYNFYVFIYKVFFIQLRDNLFVYIFWDFEFGVFFIDILKKFL